VYDELSLQRLDLVLSEAAKNGVYIILPLVNYWSDLGGMQWYVDQVGKALHKPPSAPFLG
jgi:endo-1,4-beta-mannosidase